MVGNRVTLFFDLRPLPETTVLQSVAMLPVIVQSQLSHCRIQFLRHMKEFFQLTYKVSGEDDQLTVPSNSGGDGEGEESGGVALSRQLVTLSCIGVGYSNFNKGIM